MSSDSIRMCCERLREASFLSYERKEIEEGFAEDGTLIFTDVSAHKSEVFTGSAEEQLVKIREFLSQYVIRQDMVPRKGKAYNYDLDAVMEVVGFVMGCRGDEGVMGIACVADGIVMTCHALREGSRYSACFTTRYMEDTLETLWKNGNVNSGISYDSQEQCMTAVIPVPRFFRKPEDLRRRMHTAGVLNGNIRSEYDILVPNPEIYGNRVKKGTYGKNLDEKAMKTVSLLDEQLVKYLKKE